MAKLLRTNVDRTPEDLPGEPRLCLIGGGDGFRVRGMSVDRGSDCQKWSFTSVDVSPFPFESHPSSSILYFDAVLGVVLPTAFACLWMDMAAALLLLRAFGFWHKVLGIHGKTLAV